MPPEVAVGTTDEPPMLRLAGVGAVLPGPEEACTDRGHFWDIVRQGVCCLSGFDEPGVPLRVAGQVRGWDPNRSLDLSERVSRRLSRVALLATGAVKAAIEDAGLAPGDLNNERTIVALASMQFAFGDAGRYFRAFASGGYREVGIDYWIGGTPGSVLGAVCTTLGLECPTLSTTGGCNSGARCLEMVQTMFEAGRVDRAVVVGADSTLDPVFLSGCVYESRQGFRASTLSSDPGAVRPHDEEQDGNAPGEGAVAAVLEAERSVPAGVPVRTTDAPCVRLRFKSSRRNGANPVDVGAPDNFAADVQDLLERGSTKPEELSFLNGFAEGTRNIENLFCDALDLIRKRSDYDGPLILTNQEAAFGHISGAAGLIKILSAILMLQGGSVGPSVNCRLPYSRLSADPAVEAPVRTAGSRAITISSGAGGDATTCLIELLRRDADL